MIERNLISKLLYEPELIRTCTAKEKWFNDRENRNLLTVLMDNYGEPITSTEVHERVLLKVPNSVLTVDQIEDMRLDGMVADDMDTLTEQLERRYLHNGVLRTSQEFTSYPSEGNLAKMEDAIREFDMFNQREEYKGRRLERIVDQIRHELHNDTGDGIKTYKELDRTLAGGWFGGDLAVIAARPGVGKTAYAINLAIQAMIADKDVFVDFYTLEMPETIMFKRFLTRVEKINGMRMRNMYKNLTTEEKVIIEERANKFLSTGLEIYDDRTTLRDIEVQIRRRHYEANGKPYIPIIDYLQLIEVEGSHQNENVKVGKITRTMKLLANELEIPIILLSQLNREMKPHQRPNLSNLRDSGNIEQDASIVMFLFEEVEESIGSDFRYSKSEPTNQIINYVAKNRNGITGDLFYKFFKTQMYFQEVDE